MADAKPPPTVISNSDLPQEQLDEIRASVERIGLLEERIAELHAEKLVERKKIGALGVPMQALNASLARFRMDTEQRADFDRGREIVDKALGIPIQGDLFADDDADVDADDEETLPTAFGQASASIQ